MKDWKIPLYKIYTDDEDLNMITKIIKRGSEWAIGPEIEELETLIKNYVGVDYCLTLNSGTSSLHALLIAYEIRSNHEVIVPSFSFVSTANSVLFVGAKPTFDDIESIFIPSFFTAISEITLDEILFENSSFDNFEIKEFSISKLYPNPANPNLNIEYILTKIVKSIFQFIV